VKSCDKKKLIEEIEKLKINEKFEVNSFELMKSELKPEGPEYKIIEEFKLV
jgi:2'-5' RNA ligase